MGLIANENNSSVYRFLTRLYREKVSPLGENPETLDLESTGAPPSEMSRQTQDQIDLETARK